LCTHTNEHGGYFAPPGVFLAIYIALCIIWAMLNTCAINVIAIIDTASIYWQVNNDQPHHVYGTCSSYISKAPSFQRLRQCYIYSKKYSCHVGEDFSNTEKSLTTPR
jgi:hypothetical protein